MSAKGHAREIILGIALMVFVLWYFSPTAPPLVGGTGESGEAVEDPLRWMIDRLQQGGDLEALVQVAGTYEGGGRNLFDYGVIKPPGPTPEELARLAEERRKREQEERERQAEAERLRKEAMARQSSQARDEARRAAQDATPPPPAKPVPPAIDLKFIGVIGDPADKIAIFLDGKDFLLAQEGDVVKEQFQIMKISYDTLQMGFTDPRFEEENRILPMGG